MRPRLLAVVFTVFAVGALAPALAAGQSAEPPTPLTPWGDPDLQGVWDFRTIIPLERPDDRAGQAFLTDEEAAQLEQEAIDEDERLNEPSDVDRPVLPAGGNTGAYNNFWLDWGTNVLESRRTSLIVDPPDGKLPAVQPGIARQEGMGPDGDDVRGARPVRFRAGGIGNDGPEDRGLSERCLLGFNSGPPVMPSAYNNNIQLFQTEDHVVILVEMVHDARIVPLDGRPHLSPAIRQWFGDARAHWDGDTLVVETTNFTDKTGSFDPLFSTSIGEGTYLTLTERYRRVDADTLLLEYTVDDPTTFTRPFTVQLPMRRSAEPIYEYACHEGNHAMPNMLRGARAEEQAARAAEPAAP